MLSALSFASRCLKPCACLMSLLSATPIILLEGGRHIQLGYPGALPIWTDANVGSDVHMLHAPPFCGVRPCLALVQHGTHLAPACTKQPGCCYTAAPLCRTLPPLTYSLAAALPSLHLTFPSAFPWDEPVPSTTVHSAGHSASSPCSL